MLLSSGGLIHRIALVNKIYFSDTVSVNYVNSYPCIYEYVNYNDPTLGGCVDSFDMATSGAIGKLAKKGESLAASLGIDGYEVYVTVQTYLSTKPNGGSVLNGYVNMQLRKRDFAPQKELLPPAQCPDPNPVTIGNPFMAAGGIKSQVEIDAPQSDSFDIVFKRYYSSRGAGSVLFGPNWSADYAAQLLGNFPLSQSRLDQGAI